MSLITLAMAKQHLKIDVPTTPTPDPADADILLKMAAAEEMVLDFLGLPATSPPPWTDEMDTPAMVQSAILLVFSELYRFRGDDPGTVVSSPTRTEAGSLSPMVEGMLHRLRYLVIA